MRAALWLVDAVVLLKKYNYSLQEISEFTLEQVVYTHRAVLRNEINSRKTYVTDVAASVAGVLGSELFEEHMENLDTAIDNEV